VKVLASGRFGHSAAASAGLTPASSAIAAGLADLVGRGLNADDGLLVVIDGAKALSSAVTSVFGTKAAIQRPSNAVPSTKDRM
jgi:hypothetical protein